MRETGEKRAWCPPGSLLVITGNTAAWEAFYRLQSHFAVMTPFVFTVTLPHSSLKIRVTLQGLSEPAFPPRPGFELLSILLRMSLWDV